jgi:glycosyltransferase involved in cell wall biosynthesis
MRILSFVEGADPRFGGMGLVGVPYICQALADRGHRVVLNIAGPPTPGTEQFLTGSAADVLDSREARAFGIVSYKAVGRWRFAPSLWSLSAAVKQADFVMLHSLYSFPVLTGYVLARLHRRPYGLWPHGVLAPFQRQVGARKKKIYDRLLATRMLNGASVLFYSAEGEREEAASLNLQPPSAIIPHGIDVLEFSDLPARGRFRAKHASGHRGPLVLYLGRLNAKKGLDLLVHAFAILARDLPDARLAIVGSGDPPSFFDLVRRWVSEAGLEDRVVMTGLLSHDDKRAAYADADVFVLPSQAENFAFAMFEAMASRVPVVVTDSLNFAGEVAQQGAGRVVPRLPDALAGAMSEILRDPQLRAQMGSNGLRLAESYGWQQVGEMMDRTIRPIVENALVTVPCAS